MGIADQLSERERKLLNGDGRKVNRASLEDKYSEGRRIARLNRHVFEDRTKDTVIRLPSGSRYVIDLTGAYRRLA